MTARRMWRTALQVALLLFVAWYLSVHWGEYTDVVRLSSPDWGLLAASSVVVLLSYAVLVQTWRKVVIAWGEQLSFAAALRIWFISNLAKNLPGRVWAIAAMGTLAQGEGVSPVAAVGSSLVVQLVNLVTGAGVFFIASAGILRFPGAAVAAAIALAAIAVSAPWLLPHAVQLVNRVSGKAFAVPHLPRAAIWWAAAGTTLAWCLYGLAFRIFASGISGGPVRGSVGDWTALFIGPYLLGFIAVFSTAGLGVREVAMAELLKRTGFAVGAASALLVAGSRVWLTVLEIIPGALLVLVHPLNRNHTPADP